MRERWLQKISCVLLATYMLLTRQRALADEVWPQQPIQPPPVLRKHNWSEWPGDLHAYHDRYGDRLVFWAATGIQYQHPTVLPGGLVASTGPGLFFVKRNDLDLYLGPLRALAPDVRILPAWRPLMAMERIDRWSAGGRAMDDLLGQGFVLWPPDSDTRFPDWAELLIGQRRYTDYRFQPPYVGRVPACAGISSRSCFQKSLIRHAQNAGCGPIYEGEKDGFKVYRTNHRHQPHCNDP